MKLAFKLFLFLALLFFFEKPFGYFVSVASQQRQVDRRLENIDSLVQNTDLFIVGSSRAANGIVPSIIESKIELKTYGMAYSGSNLGFHKSIVSLLYNKEKPTYLLLNIDAREAFIDYKQMIYRKDKLLPYLSNQNILKEFCKNSEKNYWLACISWAYRENQNLFHALSYLTDGKEPADITNAVNDRGYIPIHSKSESFDGSDSVQVIDFSDLEIDSTRVKSFRDILTFCKAKNVKVFISILPSFNQKVKGLNTFVKSHFVNDEVLIDLSSNDVRSKYFYDRGHLNDEGAQIITTQLAERIKHGI